MLFNLMTSASLVLGLSFSSLLVSALTSSMRSEAPIICCCLPMLFGVSLGGVGTGSVGV